MTDNHPPDCYDLPPCEECDALRARVAELERALGKAAKTAADEVLGNYGGETMAKAVFHAVKTVARAALAREGGE